MCNLTDSEEEVEIMEAVSAEQVLKDRDYIKNIIQARYPLPDKKGKKKGKK